MLFEKKIADTFRSQFLTRCDETGTVFYFSHEDFPGLQAEAYSFSSSVGHSLQGWFYHYADPIPGRILVFDHGFGGGHRAYMVEIEKLCRAGYLVFAYDHTGCMASQGENCRGLTQSLCDLNDCLNALKADPRWAQCDISVMGHSWGGFACGNIAAFHPEISRIVVLSGFVSAPRLLEQFFPGILKGYTKRILAMEQESNPRFWDRSSLDALGSTQAKVLLIYSDNDKLVTRKGSYDVLLPALEDRENVRLMLVENRGHNPNYTREASAYLGEYLAAVNKQKKQLKTDDQKAAFVASWDWKRMTAQDDTVWEAILETLA